MAMRFVVAGDERTTTAATVRVWEGSPLAGLGAYGGDQLGGEAGQSHHPVDRHSGAGGLGGAATAAAFEQPAVGQGLDGIGVLARAKKRWDREMSSALRAMLRGNVVIYLCGLIWLAHCLGTDLSKTLELGLYPFVVGELAKLYLAALVLLAAWRLADQARPTTLPCRLREPMHVSLRAAPWPRR